MSILVEDGREFTFFLTITLLPVNRHSPTGCRLDNSLLLVRDQGAERRSARKVTGLITLGNVHTPSTLIVKPL